MNRSANERLTDILAAIDRTLTYRPRLDDPDPAIAAMAYDAVLRNLAVIGEAVRARPDQVKTQEPDVPWASIAGLRNVVVHEYFRVDPTLIKDIIDNDLTALAHAAPCQPTGRHHSVGESAPFRPRRRTPLIDDTIVKR